MIDVVVLNGGSSSGKSTIARALQAQLPIPFLTFSVDDLIEAMPRAMSEEDSAGIVFTADGGVVPGPEFRRLEVSWNPGLAAIAGSGTGVILDDVFLGAAASQQRVREAFMGAADSLGRCALRTGGGGSQGGCPWRSADRNGGLAGRVGAPRRRVRPGDR